MRALPLYPDGLSVALDLVEPAPRDVACVRCPRHEGARNRCLPADGQPGDGGLLVVGEKPTREDDAVGRPLTSTVGRLVRDAVDKAWRGPVVYDLAVRCSGGAKLDAADGVPECRSFLATTRSLAKPSRIIALGPAAALAVIGRAVSSFSVRRAYAFAADGTPVFVAPSPYFAVRNPILRARFVDDIRWAATASPSSAFADGVAWLVETPAQAEEAVSVVRRGGSVSVDFETAGLLWTPSFRIVAAAVCVAGEVDAYVWGKEACADPAVREPLVRLLRDAAVPKGGANVKYDAVAARSAWGVVPRNIGRAWDSRLGAKLLDSDASGKLSVVAERVGMGGHKAEMEAAMAAAVKPIRREFARAKRDAKRYAEKGGELPRPVDLAQFGVDDSLASFIAKADADDIEDESWCYGVVEPRVITRYVARDAVSSGMVAVADAPALAADFDHVWRSIVGRTSEALARVEEWGIQVDTHAVESFDAHLARLEEVEVRALAGFKQGINWGSRPQLAKYLFGELGLPVVALTDTGAESTDADALEKLASKHPVVEHLLAYRKVVKLRSTYGLPILRHVRADGRIHPAILADGARSGRTSSQNPNMQNQPSPKKSPVEGRMSRDCFVARPGWRLVQLDYSQIELRVAAMLSQDPVMLEIFAAGVDFHLKTAQLISELAWKIPPEAVTDEHRSLAKLVNFGLLYGKKASTLAREWGCPVAVAERIVDAILGKFTRLAAWLKERLRETRATGFSWTSWAGQPARRRDMFRIADPDEWVRSNAENGTGNTPIQGTASDFLMASLVEAVEWLVAERHEAMLILPVHDSLLFECRVEDTREIIGVAREIMQGHPSGGVPLVVDVEVGKAWGSIAKWKDGMPLP